MRRLNGELIIYLSSIDWDFNWQTHQEVASALAQQGNVVLYVENTGVRMPRIRDLSRLGHRLKNWWRSVGGIRQIAEQLYVCSPLVLPFPYSRIAQRINRGILSLMIKRWMAIEGSRRPIIWTYLPTRLTLELVEELDPELLIYYCVADFQELAPRQKVWATEQELLRRADVVFAQGEWLAEHCRQVHPNVSVFPGGVSASLFERADVAQEPEDLRVVARPRLGYVGALQRHVDHDLLVSLARRHPEWSIVLIGPKQDASHALHELPNIVWLGERPHADIPRYIAHFDVGLIPYQLSAYTNTVYPSKLNEYLILGKPVVSTALPEVVAFSERHRGVIAVGRTFDEFDEHVVRALAAPNGELAGQRRAVAMESDWPKRIAEMTDIAVRALEEKRAVTRGAWSTTLQHWYRQVQLKLLSIGAALLIGYVVVLHSPLVWWVAAPLAQADALKTADAIVVFAGGVGESGKAGQGYVERVERASQLYHQGLAPVVVLSSGYVYAINETELMQSLAMSLGVPEHAIVLEGKARNTLENVQFTSAIARARGWRSVLLVSAPYHMRRSLLVYRKQAPQLRAIAAPVAGSVFFNRRGGVKLEHWRAILHEYVGIVSYWLKGWI